MRRMSAPDCFITSCGATALPSDFDIFRPFSSSTKPWVSTTSNGATPRVPQLSSSEEWNQPRCWSEPSRYITVSGPPWILRLMPARLGKWRGSSSTKACVEPESNQTSRMSVTCLPVLVRAAAEEALARARRIPGVGAFGLEGVADALVDCLVLEDFDRAVADFAHEHRDRHAPGALARQHPVGLADDHAGDAVLPLRRDPARRLDGFERAMAQAVAGLEIAVVAEDVAVHRDEPLRRVAEDHRLLGAPRVRILVLQPAARDQHAVVGQHLDHDASLASPFSPLSVSTRAPVKPGA